MEPEPKKHYQPKLKVVEEPLSIKVQQPIALTEKEQDIFTFLLETM